MRRFAGPWHALVMALAIVAASCGGGGGADSEDAGDTIIRSDDDLAIDSESLAEAADEPAVDDVDDGGAGASEGDGAEGTSTTSTTLPQEEQTTEEEFFDAVQEFQSCMVAEGVEFIGPPNAALGPEAPVNAQPYIETLIGCATRSGVQERMAEMEAERADRSPEEIEEENRLYLIFRDCMVGRGWIIPDPTPDENGMLFHGVSSTQEWIAPDGQTLGTSDDTAECQAVVQEEEGE